MAENNQIVELTPQELDRFRSRGYNNDDILPRTKSARTMTKSNYFTLWMGSIHNIPNYAAVVGYLALGISPIHTIIAIALAGLAVAVFMSTNGRAGTKYGIPFAMHLRSVYGDIGAKLPGFLRGCVAAIAWLGVQTYTGAAAMQIIIEKIWPGFANIGGGAVIAGISVPGLICFMIFWLANMAVGLGGGGILNKFTAILSPIIYVVFGGMMIWAINVGDGIGNILSYVPANAANNSTIFAYLIIIASLLSVWAAPGAAVADFTKDAESQEAQTQGQIGGLFIGHLVFAIMAVIIIIGGSIHYEGMPGGDGVLDFIREWDSIPAIILSAGVFLMTTVSTNATGNIIPAGYQLAALFPNKLDYKKGVWIAGIVSVLIMPWNFMQGDGAILTFLNLIGSLLGPVAGVMVAHYFMVVNQHINLDKLYFDTHDKAQAAASPYKGINTQAYIATIGGLIISLLGQFVPSLAWISNIAWLAGFASAFIIHLVLTRFTPDHKVIGIDK
ncbi:allantoin permease [Hutsoniella sourekii]|uniref:allantoin permease n=1 Tax=Hutsoniella sourekii TaxID=87650 RepID=UPI00047FEBDB|nr:cytosine permease [Hutsoniella sourekii]